MNKTVTVSTLAALLIGGLVGFAVKSNLPAPESPTPPGNVKAVVKETGKKEDFVQPSGYSLTPETIDLGKLREGQARENLVTLKHPGKGSVRIGRIFSTCPCLKAGAEKMIIPAGEDGTIRVKYHSIPANGKKNDHYYIELLKPEKVLLRGTVKTVVKRVPSQIMLEPPIMHFGSVTALKKQTVTFWNLTRSTMRVKVEDAGGLKVEGMDNPVTVLPGKPVEINVTADPAGLKKGSLHGHLKLSTSSDLHKAVVVPFDGTVR